MENKFCIVCFFLIILIISCSGNKDEYLKNDEYSLKKPAGWEEVKNIPDNYHVMFEKKKYQEYDESNNPRITITSDAYGDVSKDSYLKQSDMILSQNLFNYQKIFLGDFKKKNTRRLIYTSAWGNETNILKTDMMLIFNKDTVYYLTFTCEKFDYAAYLNDFYELVDSFKFK